MFKALAEAWHMARSLFLTITALGLLAAAGYLFLFAGDNRETAVLESRLEKTSLAVRQARFENTRLKLFITRLKESNSLDERIAREDANLLKENEILYIFPD